MNLSRFVRTTYDVAKPMSRLALGGLGPLIEYNIARGQGHGVPYSMGRGLVMGGLWTIAPTALITSYMLWNLGQPLGSISANWIYTRRGAISRISRPFSPDFRDNPMAMRERYMMQQEAMSSYSRARGIFGREAALMSRRYG
jgi:hypothetical protein